MKSKINPQIKEYGMKFLPKYRRIINAIKRYDRIAIFRHIMPDYDALGTQMGLATWIKDNFPNKEVVVLGDNHVTFTPRLFPVMDSKNEEWFKEPFLGIVVDVYGKKRIADPRFKKAKYKVVLDHHPQSEYWANVDVVETGAAAASEIVANMLFNFKDEYKISKEAASYLYIALVGDSGRFMYSSTTTHTFAVAEELISCGIEISKLYQQMYVKKVDDLKVTAYILNHFNVSPKGIAYYVLSEQIMKELNITTERGKENVNLFANIEGVNAWCSISEDPKDQCYRVSIRSKEKDISGVAIMFEGGGHAQASGAKLNNLETDLPRLIEELGKLF